MGRAAPQEPGSTPRIELLYFGGCPSYEAVLADLRRLLLADGIEADVELRPVETLEAAESERFLGSPTVRIDGQDVEPGAEERDDFNLSCRLYRTDGGYSPVPPQPLIRAALTRS